MPRAEEGSASLERIWRNEEGSGEKRRKDEFSTTLNDIQRELNHAVVRGNGYIMDITHIPMSNGRGVSEYDIDALLKSKKRGVKKLKGDGG